jgi:hypothetical protein
MAVKN